MKIICTFGIRHNVYKPDPEKHMGSQKSCAHNFEEEKQQVKTKTVTRNTQDTGTRGNDRRLKTLLL